jgi:hypothetical protein
LDKWKRCQEKEPTPKARAADGAFFRCKYCSVD